MDRNAPPDDREARLLREIGGLSDHVRDLRAHDAAEHGPQIKALEHEARTKWAELRALRATPSGVPPTVAGRGSWG